MSKGIKRMILPWGHLIIEEACFEEAPDGVPLIMQSSGKYKK